MRPSCTTGKVVSQYTASPSFALLVEMACFSESGTFVPEGITVSTGRAAALATGVLAPSRVAGAAWANISVESNRRVNTQRTLASPHNPARTRHLDAFIRPLKSDAPDVQKSYSPSFLERKAAISLRDFATGFPEIGTATSAHTVRRKRAAFPLWWRSPRSKGIDRAPAHHNRRKTST